MTMKFDYHTTDETRLILQLVDCDDATRRALKRQAKLHHATVEAYMSVLVLSWLEGDEESANHEQEKRRLFGPPAKHATSATE